MATYLLPVIYALGIWWLSTGLVLYAVGRPRTKHGQYMVVMSGLAVLALIATAVTAIETTVASAYCAFTSAIVVWAWHEMSFLTGYVSGPRVTPCPGRDGQPSDTAAPLLPAIQSVIYHEVAIAATAALMYGLVQDGPNRTGLWTFVILWIMRLSAKLNVYLGVRNLTEEFLPAHLVYLQSYFCRRPMNGLFPVAVTVSTCVSALLTFNAANAASSFSAASLTFLATLMWLAVLEHWFLVIPIPASGLWQWGLKSREPKSAIDTPPSNAAAKMATMSPVLHLHSPLPKAECCV